MNVIRSLVVYAFPFVFISSNMLGDNGLQIQLNATSTDPASLDFDFLARNWHIGSEFYEKSLKGGGATGSGFLSRDLG